MPRALWNGAISFGLVNIPVELYAAEDRKSFSFSMLDRRDFSPVGYKRYSKKSGREVEWSDIVKGYEYEKGQYVVLSEEDFRRANVKASETIDIAEFVPAGAIPPPFFETPYYLAPAARGGKAFALLRDALAASGQVAVAQFAMRGTAHLAAILPAGKALVLNTLRYADELRDTGALELPAEAGKGATTGKELALARKLIDDMAGQWKPSDFRDTYHQDLLKRIHEKVKRGETHELTTAETKGEAPRRSAEVIDLAELLRNSLRGGKDGARTSQRATRQPAADAAKAAAARTPAGKTSAPKARAAQLRRRTAPAAAAPTAAARTRKRAAAR